MSTERPRKPGGNSAPYWSPHAPAILSVADLDEHGYEPRELEAKQWNASVIASAMHEWTLEDVSEVLGIDVATADALAKGVMHATMSHDGQWALIPDVMLPPEAVVLRRNFARVLSAIQDEARPPRLADADAAVAEVLAKAQSRVRKATPPEELSDEFKQAMREAHAGNLTRGQNEVAAVTEDGTLLTSEEALAMVKR